MMNMRERYHDDAIFHKMVDSLVQLIESGMITPTETREAAMLAQIIYEGRNPRPVTFTREDFLGGKV